MRYELVIVRWLDATEDSECSSPTKVRGPVERMSTGWLTEECASDLRILTERCRWTGGKTEYSVTVIPASLVCQLLRTGVKTDPTALEAHSFTTPPGRDGARRPKSSAVSAGRSTTSRSAKGSSTARKGV